MIHLSSGDRLLRVLQAGISACCEPEERTRAPEEAGRPAALWFHRANDAPSARSPANRGNGECLWGSVCRTALLSRCPEKSVR